MRYIMTEQPKKTFRWNEEKNSLLQIERGLGFEVVLSAIEEGKILDIVDHPNQEKYPNQRMFIIEINQYVYVVPFVENEQEIFLKTIIPNRKMKRKYLGD
jgi:uncharacterized DUF497 family protein